MKKAVCLLLAAILAVACIPLLGTAASAPQYAVEDKTVQVGEVFTMDVAVAENPGIISLRFKVVYDTGVLELQSVENKGILNGFTTPAPGITSPYTLRWADSLATADNTVQGVVVTLTFKALQVTPSTEVTIEHGEARNSTGTKVAFSSTSAAVTVKEIPVNVAGVTLDKNTLSLKTGESETLAAAVDPANATNKTVSWKSDNTSVATVDDNGKVTALKEGSATITVITEDGSFSASCAVSVACSHTDKTETPAKSPDCVNPGNNKYYTCGACGDVFKADGATETTVKDETIAALKHDFTEKIKDAAHLVPGTGTNCQNVEKYYYDCSRCDVIGTAAYDGIVGAHVMATDWTAENGTHYHKCTVSGCTYVEDEGGCSDGTATCVQKAVCGTCGHEYGSLAACNFTAEKAEDQYLKSEATCVSKTTYYKSCTVCGKADAATFAYGEVDAQNHVNTEVRDVAVSNCTDSGYTGDTWCLDCNTKIADGKVVQAGHKLNKVAYKPATHEVNGNIEYYTCNVCDKLFADDEAAKELTEAETVIAKAAHTYTMQSDSNGHWKSCDCGSKIEAGEHIYGEWVTVKKADVGVEGSKERSCTVCGYKQTEKIPAITSPETGDGTGVVMVSVLMLASLLGIFVLYLVQVPGKSKYQR